MTLSNNQKRKMRSAARLYAVQALFQMETTEQTTEGVCREIEGSDGTQFPAYVKKEDRLWV